jgi:hypothetical protein
MNIEELNKKRNEFSQKFLDDSLLMLFKSMDDAGIAHNDDALEAKSRNQGTGVLGNDQ